MTDGTFFEVDEIEQGRRIALCFQKYPALGETGCTPDMLVQGGLVPGHFDLTADGDLVTASEEGEMIVEVNRTIQALA